MDEKLLEVFHKNKEVAFATAVDGKLDLRTNPPTLVPYDF